MSLGGRFLASEESRARNERLLHAIDRMRADHG